MAVNERVLFGYPNLPIMFRFVPNSLVVDKLRLLKGLNVFSETWMTRAIDDTEEISTKINAGMMFEALAICAELNAVAQCLDPAEAGEIIEEFIFNVADDLYGGLLRLYTEQFDLPAHELMVCLPAVIDVALMYDTSLLYGNTPFFPAPDHPYRPPAETLFRLLQAAKRIEDVSAYLAELTSFSGRNFSLALRRYRDDLCKEAKVPTEAELVVLALDNLVRVAPFRTFVQDQGRIVGVMPEIWKSDAAIDLRVPFALHWFGLKMRANNPALFADLMHPDAAAEFYHEARGLLTLVDAETRTIPCRSQLSSLDDGTTSLARSVDRGDQRHVPVQEGRTFLLRQQAQL